MDKRVDARVIIKNGYAEYTDGYADGYTDRYNNGHTEHTDG